MLRRLTVLSLVALIAASVSFAGESAWFDMEKCDMCKSISKNPVMMKNITWEQANISNGIVCVTTMPTEYVQTYRDAHEGMMQTAARMQKGEQMNLCGSCTALGGIMTKMPHQEYAQTSTGDVWILTSDKPEVVTELQAWAKRNSDEMAMMMKSEGHEGHAH
jgi:hypothetical protein